MSVGTMNSVRDCVHMLSDAMEAFRPESPAALVEVVSAYVATATDVNERLRTAHALLRQGRREEALHACDTEPNLLDCVAELDSSDQAIEAWAVMLDDLGVSRPPKLLSDLAAELGAAYDVKHQLSTLMRSHRLLAIGRGPLEQRVQVLRRIAEMDPDNPSWPADLSAYEGECQKQIAAELATFARLPAADITPSVVSRAKQLVTMLSSGDWQEPLTADAVRRTRGMLTKLQQAQAGIALDQLAGRLAAAAAASDLDEAVRLVEKWNKYSKRSSLSHDHPHADAALACVAWVREEAETQQKAAAYNSASDALAMACGEATPLLPGPARILRQRIHSLVHDYTSLAFDLGEDSASTAHEALRRIRTLDAVPIRFWSVLLASLLLVVAGASFGVLRVLNNAHRARVIADVRLEIIDGHCREEDLHAANSAWMTYVSKEEWLHDHPVSEEVADCLKQLDGKRASYVTRCKAHLEEASKGFDPARTSFNVLQTFAAAEEPLTDSVIQARDEAQKKCASIDREIARANKELNNLTLVSGSTSETELRRQTENHEKQLHAIRAELKDLCDALAKASRSAVATRLKNLESTSVNASPDRGESLLWVRSMVEGLERFTGGQEPMSRERLEALEEKSRSHSALFSLGQRLSQACDESLTAYLRAVSHESKHVDGGSVAEDLASVSAQKPWVESALAWSDVAAHWGDRLPLESSPARRLMKYLQVARGMSVQPAFAPDELQRLSLLCDYLAECTNDSPTSLQSLAELLEQPIMQPDVLVVNVSQKPFYTRQPEKLEGKCFRDESAVTRWNGDVKGAADSVAPHVRIAQTLRDAISRIQAGKADITTGMTDALSQFPSSTKVTSADAVVQCLLLSTVLDVLEGCVLFRDDPSLEKLGEDIDVGVGATPRWIDPEARDSQTLSEATKILRDSRKIRAVEDAYQKALNALQNRPDEIPEIVFFGWLDKTPNLHVRDRRAAEGASGTLYVLAAVDEAHYECLKVGEVDRGRITLGSAATSQLYGSPVFLAMRKSYRSGESRVTGTR